MQEQLNWFTQKCLQDDRFFVTVVINAVKYSEALFLIGESFTKLTETWQDILIHV